MNLQNTLDFCVLLLILHPKQDPRSTQARGLLSEIVKEGRAWKYDSIMRTNKTDIG